MGVFGVFRGLGKGSAESLKGAIGSEILDGGQKVIEGMRLTTGAGAPENGERFGQGWSRFNSAGATLTAAFPNDSWAGAAADAYAGQNRSQTGRTHAVALLDRDVQTVIAREAYQIAYHRDKLDGQSNFLADLSYVTTALGLVPGYGKAMKATVEAAAVQAALSVCSLELYQLSREAEQNAAELLQSVGRYEDAAKTEPPPSPPDEEPPGDEPPGAESPPENRQPQDEQSPAPAPGSVAPSPGSAAVPRAATPAPTPSTAPPSPPPGSAAPPQTPPFDGPGLLGAALAPLGALLAGVGQLAAAAGSAAPTKAVEQTDDEQEDEHDEDNETARSGREEGETERAPLRADVDVDPDLPQVPKTDTFDGHRPPTPPAPTRPPA